MIRLTWKRFRAAARLLAKSEKGPKAILLAAALVVFMLWINVINVISSFIGRDFMSAIADKNMPAFKTAALLYAIVFNVFSISTVLFRFTEKRLSILWREQLTRRLTEAYLSERTYFHLNSSTGVANPDQRISEDVRAFTKTTLSFFILLFNGTITAVSFSGVLWTISPFLFAVGVVYAVLGSAMTVLLGKPLIRLNYRQLDMEAEFRNELIHVRENSDCIALTHREETFKASLLSRLDALSVNLLRLFRVERNLGFFTEGYNIFITIIPALIIAPLFVFGRVEFGVLTQASMAFTALLGAFSIIVNQFQSISTLTAVTARLRILSDAIEYSHSSFPCEIEVEECPDRVSYEDLTLKSSDNSKVLLDNLNLKILRGSRWLFSGVDDEPKTALFRATAGLWDCGRGRIFRPGLDDIFFLPERPYLPPGTLREVLMRAEQKPELPDADVFLLLQSLGLNEIVARVGGLDVKKDWNDVFSIGEQHMLTIARILLTKPTFVFLDRPDSSLPSSTVLKVLNMLNEINIGAVVFSNKLESSLDCDSHLEIKTNGTWEVHEEMGGPGQS